VRPTEIRPEELHAAEIRPRKVHPGEVRLIEVRPESSAPGSSARERSTRTPSFCFLQAFQASLPWRAIASCCSSAIVDHLQNAYRWPQRRPNYPSNAKWLECEPKRRQVLPLGRDEPAVTGVSSSIPLTLPDQPFRAPGAPRFMT
jgi:hypothetical protein